MGMSKQQALEAIVGLTFADCFQFFNEKATTRDKKIAAMVHAKDGELEVDGAILSESGDNGAYVLTWTWVPFAGTIFDRQGEPIKLLGYTFNKMSDNDYMGFAGASDDAYICYVADAVLIWDPVEEMLSEIKQTPDNDLKQRDWKLSDNRY
jgi:hypothetical protein